MHYKLASRRQFVRVSWSLGLLVRVIPILDAVLIVVCSCLPLGKLILVLLLVSRLSDDCLVQLVQVLQHDLSLIVGTDILYSKSEHTYT